MRLLATYLNSFSFFPHKILWLSLLQISLKINQHPKKVSLISFEIQLEEVNQQDIFLFQEDVYSEILLLIMTLKWDLLFDVCKEFDLFEVNFVEGQHRLFEVVKCVKFNLIYCFKTFNLFQKSLKHKCSFNLSLFKQVSYAINNFHCQIFFKNFKLRISSTRHIDRIPCC